MKILTTLSTLKTSRDSNSNKSVSGTTITGRSLFSTELLHKESNNSEFKTEIENLKNEIDVAGEKLENEPTLANFRRFRDALSMLAKRINSEAYRLEKFGGTPQNPRYYEIITTIDKEADQLYKLIIHSHLNNMAITEKVIGIKGLVIDLTT